MKKQMLFIVVMILIMAGLLAIWLLAGKQQSSETEVTTPAVAAISVLDLKAADIASIRVSNEYGEYSLVSEIVTSDGKDNLIWKMSESEDLPYDENRLSTFASELIGLEAEKEIADDTPDLAPYGLDDPDVSISFIAKSGETVSLIVGDTLSSGESEYVAIGDRVVSISSSKLVDLKQRNLFWLDRLAVLNISYNEIEYFSLSRSRDELDLSAECEFIGSEDDKSTPALSFEIVSPINNSGDDSKLGQLLQQLVGIRAAEYLEMGPQDLSIYGLDKPAYVFEIETATGTTEIRIGDSAGSGRVYALSSNLDGVFTVDLSTLTSIDIPLDDLIYPFVSLHNIDSVSRIEADIYDTSFTVDLEVETGKSAADESVTFLLDGKNAKVFSQTNNTLHSEFYQSIIGVKIAGVDSLVQPENSAEAVLKFMLKADQESGEPARTQIVEFARRDDYTDYVFIDGEYTGCYIDRDASFYSDAKGSEGIVTAYKMMKYAMENAVDGVFDTGKGYKLD